MNESKRLHQSIAVCALLLFVTANILGSTNQLSTAHEIADLPVEELLQVRVVTSVSKRPEPLLGASSAIFLLTGEDVRREGFRTIADSLRYVPGMNVAQINSHTWAVSSRGFNAEYATKLLVLMDGRSVYTPLNAGVYWDTVDLMQEDLDRIEVIRGPGGTLWGANAVNGVINIISKPAQETQGALITGGGGNHEKAFAAVRYGGQLGEQTFYRVYGKYDLHGPLVFPNGDDGEDGWEMARTGFRLDTGTEEADLLTVQGDFYFGNEDWLYTQPIGAAPAPPPYEQTQVDEEQVLGANLLARWTHTFENESQLIWQTYFDHTDRESNLPNERRDTFDSEVQYQFVPLRRNDVVAGMDYRLTTDSIENNYANSFSPAQRTLNLVSVFIQDEITLVEDHLRLTAGTKLEYNDFTGFEFQPSGRLAWTPSESHTIWAGISRAVRTPSRAEDDVTIHRTDSRLPPGTVVTIQGDESGKSEDLMACELGYRTLCIPRVTLDIAGFYNVYNNLRSFDSVPTFPPVITVGNNLRGESWGVELAIDWQMLDWWRWRATYTYFELSLRAAENGTDPVTMEIIQLLEGSAPRNQFSLRSQLDLPYHIGLDAGLRYVGSLENPPFTAAEPEIPAYTALDVRLSWHPRPNLEISVVGLDVLDPSHPEFAPTQVDTPLREVVRSVYGQMTWHF